MPGDTLFFRIRPLRSCKTSAAVASLLFLVLSVITMARTAVAENAAGFVKTLEGDAVVIRQGRSIAVFPGCGIDTGDIVQTGAKSALGIVFTDDTRVSLGPETQITVDHYLFDPHKKQLGLITRLIKGTLSFISGQITKLSPESARIVVPSATIGVRGTHVLVSVDN